MIRLSKTEHLIHQTILHHLPQEDVWVFLFGSRAGKNCEPASDYDVGLYRGQIIPLQTIAQIRDDLEEYLIPVDVDLVDFSSVSPEFQKTALKKVVIWNRPRNGSKLNGLN